MFFKIDRGLLLGIAVSLAAALLAVTAAQWPWNSKLQLSALTLAIVLGMVVGNVAPQNTLKALHSGLRFSQQRLLRLGIVLYGVRLTLHDLTNLGPRAFLLDLMVIAGVLTLGFWIGVKVLGLDQDTALLVSAGSGICGAAAVLATDRVIESESHKVSVAVATVVVFGTLAMFLYPLVYPHLGFTDRQYGIYTGATVHEVAQALAAGRAVSQAASDTAVITKMLRVLMLAPVLFIIGWMRKSRSAASTRPISYPWFVLWFAAVIVVQSLITVSPPLRMQIINMDTVLLASAMFALGIATRWQSLRTAGPRPLLLASIIFAGLSCGGWAMTKLLL